MPVFCECCVLLGRDFCVVPITRPVVRRSECNREASTMTRPRPTRECCVMGVKRKYLKTLGTRGDTSNKIITVNKKVPVLYMQYASYRLFSLEDVENPLQEYPTTEPDTFRI
jgi:hypothetical protein